VVPGDLSRVDSDAVRWWAGIGLGLAVGLACASDDPFRCVEDGQCRLGGTPGVCALGHCAYPDASCDSGFRYPVGAGNGLAGTCAEPNVVSDSGASATDSNSGSDSASDSDSDSDATSESSDPSTESTSESTTDPTVGSSTASTTDPETTSDSSTGIVDDCEQENSEPNDTLETAATFSPTCSFVIGGAAGGTDPSDWYRPEIDPACRTAPTAVMLAANGGALRVCAVTRCSGGTPVMECSETTSIVGSVASCCGEILEVTSSCSPNSVQETFLHVEDLGGACVAYTVSFDAT
jgi:hypothetical protein